MSNDCLIKEGDTVKRTMCQRLISARVRSRHHTYISKVIQHPSKVMELQIKKEKTKTHAGHAPKEDYISVHICVVGDFIGALAKAVGCNFEEKGKKGVVSICRHVISTLKLTGLNTDEAGGKVISTDVNPPYNRTLPRVMVDGPFGSASEDFLDYKVVLLVGAGIGVTPFASILKSIWYQMNNFNYSRKPTRLSKVYPANNNGSDIFQQRQHH
ncbi:hypothetical protein D9758_017012 [Tetrapyrgos nigripes]|uniref:Ferric reductase NAD binding domain-containing protein n=1 Tax=Tetrapyrgos nigripes TaxID=182062 RepID=A0A8H5BU81_9AGAR|nr:hypothetical protein D9758_017012 [Tetrapyrgos nigripes]